jgi:hypothetical protein
MIEEGRTEPEEGRTEPVEYVGGPAALSANNVDQRVESLGKSFEAEKSDAVQFGATPGLRSGSKMSAFPPVMRANRTSGPPSTSLSSISRPPKRAALQVPADAPLPNKITQSANGRSGQRRLRRRARRSTGVVREVVPRWSGAAQRQWALSNLGTKPIGRWIVGTMTVSLRLASVSLA